MISCQTFCRYLWGYVYYIRLRDRKGFAVSSSPIIEKSSANAPHLSRTANSPELNEPAPGAEHEQHGHGVEWAELARIAFVALAAAAVWFRLWEPFSRIP